MTPELEKFYNTLIQEMDTNRLWIEPNNDRTHNTTIMRAMLDKNQHIQMYCGEMSVFRDEFYDYINRDTKDDATVERLGDDLKAQLIKSLDRFLDRPSSKLEVFVQNPFNMKPVDWISPRLIEDGQRKGKITIYAIDHNKILLDDVSHVTMGDTKIIRMETDMYNHEAICAINPPDTICEPVKTVFTHIRKASTPTQIR